MKLVAIAGGIGSGKSVVSRVLIASGYPVYDCDARARAIMDNDAEIHARLCAEIHSDAVCDGFIDRALISSVVFNDPDALARLNNIVHRAVTADLIKWRDDRASEGNSICFFETAILRSSGLYRIADDIWIVDAPADVRIERVIRRSGLDAGQVRARMAAQSGETFDDMAHHLIVNTPDVAVLPQIEALLGYSAMQVQRSPQQA